ncbi:MULTISPECIES: PAS domain-containing protein [Marinobacter]|uniref:PAS domain-containing protein n=1 Tax=Marinobacter TaxID=2742 RepID=UPI001B1C20C3|nr:PAS domain-containing protein [Marinobacter sp.]MBO6809700.1 PAS domain-containing protein [Marinobacter sp.]MBO6872464.1 PAS domain-containing protein [Marinobacter sp.]
MKAPDLPPEELERQAALERTGLLDTEPEERFDRFTRMACNAFRVPIALVSLVDENRQWFKSCQGLSASETSRGISFCGHAILNSSLLVIEDASLDPRFSDNPLVTGDPHIRFYAGAPLHNSEGFRLGTLCLIDRVPRTFGEEDESLLREIADCVEREINLRAAAEFYRDLKHSERRARAIIDGTRIGTWEWNVQTGETVFNERWANICGYTLEELEPVSIQTWLGLAHPDDLPESERLLNAHFVGELPEYDYRCRMKHRDGHWVWVHDRGQVFEWTPDGKPLMMYGTHADITQEMDNLNKIKHQNEALSILSDLALDAEPNDGRRIEKALRLGADYLDLPLGIVSEIHSNVYSIQWFVAPEGSGLEQKASFPLKDTYCSMLLGSRESLAIAHMAKSSYRGHRCYDKFGLESYLAAPIFIRDRLYGTLNFSSPDPREEDFTETEVTFVTLLARWVGALIERQISVRMITKLVEQTPGMLYQYRLWPDGRGAFPYSSPSIKDIYGVTPEEVQEDATICFTRIHPDDLPKVAASIDESAQTLSIWHCHYRVDNGQSGWRWVEGKSSPELMPDGSIIWHGYIADIDEAKQTELALQESEAQLRGFYELSPIGIALNDYRTGAFLDVNDALLRPTGYNRNQLMGLGYWQLLPPEFEDQKQRIIAELQNGRHFGPHEVEIMRADTSTYPAIVRGMRISSPSGQPLIWTLIEDISERKKVDRMKSEFISTVSHELRTPLTSISGSLGLVESGTLGALPEKAERMVSIAHRNTEQLKELVNDLLDMEKLVSGKMTMNLQLHELDPVIKEAVERLGTYALESGVTVRVQSSSPKIVSKIDRSRLGQAFTNLLSNAIKFSPPDGQVLVQIKVEDSRVRIRVIDQGPGIPEGFRGRIFQKFAQADSSDTRGKRGTGLGLAITKEIMTQMGGDVGFQSREGKGSTFWLELAQVKT